MDINNITMIQKEDVALLHFPKEEVLFSKEDREEREKELEKSIKLGNLDHTKVSIIFQDIEGVKRVETTVWGVTDKEIILKKGVIIPIWRIHEVSFV